VQAVESNTPGQVQAIDNRIIEVSIEIDGKTHTYTGLNIVASGMKYANGNQNECEVKISNLDKPTRDFLMTATTPFNLKKTPKTVTIKAGRVSYGTTKIFSGEVVASSISQPPDITITLKCLTKNFQQGNIISTNQSATASVKQIATNASNLLGTVLNYQALDKNVSNYSYNGPTLKQVDKLNELGSFNAYIDDDVLVVKDFNKPLSNKVKVLSLETGMIGVPQFTEEGIQVTYLLDNVTVLGGMLRIQSRIYPACNGDYCIYKLGFEIATRETPFYYTAEAKRL
jgi:hypothetical protein